MREESSREKAEEEGGEKEDGRSELGHRPAPSSGAAEAMQDAVQREPDGLASARGSAQALLDPAQREPDGLAAAGARASRHVDDGGVVGDGGVLASEKECSECIQSKMKMGSNCPRNGDQKVPYEKNRSKKGASFLTLG